MTSYEYIPKGICPSMIKVFVNEKTDTVESAAILGGCHGNFIALIRLLKGCKVQEAIQKLEGIKCGN